MEFHIVIKYQVVKDDSLVEMTLMLSIYGHKKEVKRAGCAAVSLMLFPPLGVHTGAQ